jgi:lipopolysaccharide export system permease protein
VEIFVKITPTLSGYLAKRYIMNMLFVLGLLLAIVYLFESVELIRRAAKRDDTPLFLVLQMSLLKLPQQGQMLLPFAILYSAMFTFWQLTRRYELVVVRAAGFSFWQFLAPIIGVAIVAGLLHMTVINPVSSLLIAKFQRLERTVIERKESQIALFKDGLWLRQDTDEGYVILQAPKIQQATWSMKNPMALFFTKEDQYLRRIDAASAVLEQEQWIFRDVIVQKPEGPAHQDEYVLPTSLTRADVENSFSLPSSMSFWRLPAHIQTLEETGFDPSRLQVYYQNLLSQPLMFVAMVLLAACVAMRPPRMYGTLGLIVIGVFIGFVVFFMSSFLQAMGSSRQIPVVMAAWAPALISFLLGLGVMINFEDG